MDFQYIVDEKGRKKSVITPIKEWEKRDAVYRKSIIKKKKWKNNYASHVHMANRHLSRSIVLQSLYEWDFGHKTYDEALDIFRWNAEEFAPGMGDFSFMDKQ